jgi:hypothetical protein
MGQPPQVPSTYGGLDVQCLWVSALQSGQEDGTVPGESSSGRQVKCRRSTKADQAGTGHSRAGA